MIKSRKITEPYYSLLKVNTDLLCAIIRTGGSDLSEEQLRQRLTDACTVLHAKTTEQAMSVITDWPKPDE